MVYGNAHTYSRVADDGGRGQIRRTAFAAHARTALADAKTVYVPVDEERGDRVALLDHDGR